MAYYPNTRTTFKTLKLSHYKQTCTVSYFYWNSRKYG